MHVMRTRAHEPDPETPEKAERRSFTAAYKLQILERLDEAEAGQIGALLRSEGLYSWRCGWAACARPGVYVPRQTHDCDAAVLVRQHLGAPGRPRPLRAPRPARAGRAPSKVPSTAQTAQVQT